MSASSRPLTSCVFRRFFSSSTYHRSEANIVKSKIEPIEIPKLPISNFVWDHSVKHHGEKVAMEHGITGQTYTYDESYKLVKSFRNTMIKKGYKKGDVIAIMLPNSPAYILSTTGALGAGVIVTTINPSYTPHEVARQIKMSKAKAILSNVALLPVVNEAIQLLGHWRERNFYNNVTKTFSNIDPVEVILEDSNDGQSLEQWFKDDSDGNNDFPNPPDFNYEDDVAILPFSSGTTGLPKGVMLTHKSIVSNIAQCVFPKSMEFIEPATETFQPTTVCILPMFHAFGLFVTSLPTLHVGGKIVTLPTFEPNSFLKAVENTKPGFLHLAPPLVQFCAYHPQVLPSHLENLKYMMCGAAPIGEGLAKKFKEKAPNCVFREGWGMTELSPVGTLHPMNKEVLGSCGVLLPQSEAKIVDLITGEILPAGKTGELCIRGPHLMKGYLDNEEATKETLIDGWLHSGDIAYYDDDQHFYIVDRLKELIKVKGFQVAPAELEDLLRQHPKVSDVAVIGIPHDKFGEVPRAYIVANQNEVLEEEIHQFLDEKVTDFKKLRGGIEFVGQIPKSPSGKILRRELRDALKSK